MGTLPPGCSFLRPVSVTLASPQAAADEMDTCCGTKSGGKNIVTTASKKVKQNVGQCQVVFQGSKNRCIIAKLV